MLSLRALFVTALLLLTAPAQAADVIYPAGSRIGLAPPAGMTPSRGFFGFEDVDKNVAIAVVAMPPEAFRDVAAAMSPAGLKQQGLTFETREVLTLAAGRTVLAIGRQDGEGAPLRKWIAAVATPALTALVTIQVPDAARAAYPDEAMRAALATLAVRPHVPVEEQLGLLPFKLTELAQFRIGGLFAGRAVMLTDSAIGRTGPIAMNLEPYMVISIAPGGPARGANRDLFARDVFDTIPNLRDVRITSSEPLRIGGVFGHQVMAAGKDSATGADITIVQWLRFGSGAYMQIVGVAPQESWLPAYARFRQVRDGIDTH